MSIEADHGRRGRLQSPSELNDGEQELGTHLLLDSSEARPTLPQRGQGAEGGDLLVAALDYAETPPAGDSRPEQKIKNPEFTERNFADALRYAADTGKPILAIFGNPNNSDFSNYQQTVLPQLRKQFGDRAVFLIVNTATQEGRAVAQQSAWRYFGETQLSYTMLLHVKQGGGFEEVNRSRYRGASTFIPAHMEQLLPQAYAAMVGSGFRRRPENDAVTVRTDGRVRETPGQVPNKTEPEKPRTIPPERKPPETKERPKEVKTEPKKSEPKTTKERKPGATQEGNRFYTCPAANGTDIEYRYEQTNKGNEPDTIVIDGIAWVPKPGSQRTVWLQFKKQNDKWQYVPGGDWAGNMWVTDKGELAFQPKGKEKVTWTMRGGAETTYGDGSSVEVDRKKKHVLRATRSDGSSVEPEYENNTPIRYRERVKLANGQLEEVVWQRRQNGKPDDQSEWESEQRPGTVRIGLKLHDNGELKFRTPDGAQHTVDRTGSHRVFEQQAFGNGTLREFTSKIRPDGSEELVIVRVTTPDKKVYRWEKVGEDSWTCNGGGPQLARFERIREGQEKKYVTGDLENNLRKVHDTSGKQQWFQPVTVGGETKHNVFEADANGKVTSFRDAATNNCWTLGSDGVWSCGSQSRKGELKIAKDHFSFFDKGTGDSFVFKDDVQELQNKGKTLAKFDKLGRQRELISPNGRARRLFEYDGDSDIVITETVIRPNQTIVWGREKEGSRYTDNWRAESEDGAVIVRSGRGEFKPDFSYIFKHRDSTEDTVERSGDETVSNVITGSKAVYKQGVLYSIRFADYSERVFGWEPGKENQVLNALTVTTTDGTVYKWKKLPGVSESWSCNGGKPQFVRFNLRPNLDYVYEHLDDKSKAVTYRAVRHFDGRKVIENADKSRVESDRHGITKVVTSGGESTVIFTRDYSRLEKIEEFGRDGTALRTWTRQGNAYTDGTQTIEADTVQATEDGQYTFINYDTGIHHLCRPGQKPERRGELADFNQLLAIKFADDPDRCTRWQSRAKAFDKCANDEGLPRRELVARYRDLSSKLSSATSQADFDKVWNELRPRPLLLERRENVSDEYAGMVEKILDSIPQGLRKRYMQFGNTFVVAQKIADIDPDFAKQKAVGQIPGLTMINLEGFYFGDRKQGIATEYFRDFVSGNWVRVGYERAQAVVAHELFHGLDRVLGNGERFSESTAFKQAIDRDIANMSEYARIKLRYLIKHDPNVSGRSCPGGRKECLADVGALLTTGRVSGGDPELVRQNFKNVVELMDKTLKGYR